MTSSHCADYLSALPNEGSTECRPVEFQEQGTENWEEF